MSPDEIAIVTAAAIRAAAPSPTSWLGPALFTLSGTIAAALLAAFLAHRKLSLDLFEKRFENYELIMRLSEERQKEILTSGPDQSATDNIQALRELWAASRKTAFLFGPEVGSIIKDMEVNFLSLHAIVIEMRNPQPSPRDTALILRQIEAQGSCLSRAIHLQEAFASRAAPYLRQYGWWDRMHWISQVAQTQRHRPLEAPGWAKKAVEGLRKFRR